MKTPIDLIDDKYASFLRASSQQGSKCQEATGPIRLLAHWELVIVSFSLMVRHEIASHEAAGGLGIPGIDGVGIRVT